MQNADDKDYSVDLMDFEQSDDKIGDQLRGDPNMDDKNVHFEKSPKQEPDKGRGGSKKMGLLNDDFSDEDDPDADKRSNDSVDMLWQAVLNNKHE
jgi:hypothetical protein